MANDQSLLFSADTSARSAMHVLSVSLAHETVQLHAQRALYWPRMCTLFVADVHLGKDSAFRAGGIPLPSGAAATDLERLATVVEHTGATRLVILGDLLHAASGRVPALDAAVCAWRERQPALEVTLIRGNHDDHAGDPPAHWRITTVPEPHLLAPFLACHLPVNPTHGYALCGHVHPGAWLGGRADPSVRLPCFVVGPRRAILPAFGRLTGLFMQPPEAGDRFVAIAGSHLVALPQRTR
jgi:DNA ligase-associated metallophosphoesterase